MELPVGCPKHTEKNKITLDTFIFFFLEYKQFGGYAITPSGLGQCVLLLQNLDLALQDVSFVRELLHQILVSAAKHQHQFYTYQLKERSQNRQTMQK